MKAPSVSVATEAPTEQTSLNRFPSALFTSRARKGTFALFWLAMKINTATITTQEEEMKKQGWGGGGGVGV